ncbi:MAG: prepilin-type N-terminal cleavage/methylation domain-containing protein [Candidatus Saccharimonadales bacterium]
MKVRINSKEGFTIMELMIAISILSIILLISSMVLIGVGNLYSKGEDLANVQDVNRNILENATSTIQFNGTQLNNGVSSSAITYDYAFGGVNVPTYAYCFGQTRYSFVTGFNLPAGWSHLLWLDKMSTQGNCSPLNISQASPSCSGNSNCVSSQSGSGSELMGANMHLATFNIEEFNPQLYGISVGIAFGQKGLFISNANGPEIINGQNYQCSNSSGQQYCATSYLTTFATERLSQQ